MSSTDNGKEIPSGQVDGQSISSIGRKNKLPPLSQLSAPRVIVRDSSLPSNATKRNNKESDMGGNPLLSSDLKRSATVGEQRVAVLGAPKNGRIPVVRERRVSIITDIDEGSTRRIPNRSNTKKDPHKDAGATVESYMPLAGPEVPETPIDIYQPVVVPKEPNLEYLQQNNELEKGTQPHEDSEESGLIHQENQVKNYMETPQGHQNLVSAAPLLTPESDIGAGEKKTKLTGFSWFQKSVKASKKVVPDNYEKSIAVSVPNDVDDGEDTNQLNAIVNKPLIQNQAEYPSRALIFTKPFHVVYDFLSGPFFHAPGFVFSLQGLDKTMFVRQIPGPYVLPFHPHSLFLQIWNSIVQITIVMFCIILPVCLSLPHAQSWLKPSYQVLTLVSFLNIFIQANKGYIDHRVLEMTPSTVRYHYFTSLEFISDAFISIPWVYIADHISESDIVDSSSQMQLSNTPARLLCLLSTYSFVSLLVYSSENRVFFLTDRIAMMTRVYNVKTAFASMALIVLTMFFYWHWASCGMLFMEFAGFERKLIELENTPFNLYSHAFFHAVSETMSAGWAVPNPSFAGNTVYIWLRTLNIIIAASLLAVFVGNISSVMIGLDSSGRQFQEKIEEVSQYSRYKGFDDEIRNKIREYYDFKYNGGKYFDEHKILGELNPPLRQLIAIHDCESLIVKVPFFATANPLFISQVVIILKPVHFLPGDIIIEEGTDGDEMYFISTGTVEVLVEGDLIATLVDGQFFGEIAVVIGKMKRTATVKAVTKCLVYMLSRSQMNPVLEDHPEMAERFRVIAKQRMQATARSVRASAAASPNNNNNNTSPARPGSEKRNGENISRAGLWPHASLDSSGNSGVGGGHRGSIGGAGGSAVKLNSGSYLGVDNGNTGRLSRASSPGAERSTSGGSGSNMFLQANEPNNHKRASSASRYSKGGSSYGDNWTRIILLLQANQALHDQPEGASQQSPAPESHPLVSSGTVRKLPLLSFLGPKINQIPESLDPTNERGWGRVREIVRTRKIFELEMDSIKENESESDQGH